MEFIAYEEVLTGLREQGVVEVEDDNGFIRLEIEPAPRIKILHIKCSDSKAQPYPDAVILERSKADLPQAVRYILGKLHLNEVLVIPVGTWRQLIDCIAFDLAEDESWLEIDAIAAMHQNTRNPLAIIRGETQVLISMIEALFNLADSQAHEIMITSDIVPLLIEVFHDGAISISCATNIADELSKSI